MTSQTAIDQPTWRTTTVGNEEDLYLPYLRLHAFRARMLDTSPNLDQDAIAVFAKYDVERATATWFFSPEADFLAHTFAAQSCEKPLRDDGLVLLTGNGRAWQIHFP